MGDDEAGIYLAFHDLLKKRLCVSLNMGLPHLEGETLVHRRPDRDFVPGADIHARDRDRPRLAAAHDGLAENVNTIGGEESRGLHLVEDSVSSSMTRGFASHRVDATIGAAFVRAGHQLVIDIGLREVDCFRATCFGHRETFRNLVDGDHPSRTHHQGRTDGELPDWSAAPDSDSIAILNLGIFRRHVSGRKDVGQKERLLVADVVRNFNGADVCHGHAKKPGLSAGIAPEHVTETEQPRGRLAHRFTRDLCVRIGPVAAREKSLLAEPALATANRKGNDDPVAHLEIGNLAAQLDYFAHVFVAEYVAAFHRRLIPVEQMKIGTANGAGRDLDDGIPRMLNFRVGDRVHADIALAVPTECAHSFLLALARAPGWLSCGPHSARTFHSTGAGILATDIIG